MNNFGSLPDPLVPPPTSHPAGSSKALLKRLVDRNLQPQYAMAILPSKWSRCTSPKTFSVLRIHDVVTQ